MTDTILLISGSAQATDRMIAYAVAAAERAKIKGWDVLTLSDEFLELRPHVTMFGECAEPFQGDEYAMELCDKILLLGSDERISAMFDYILTLYDKEIWKVSFGKKRYFHSS